MNTLVMLAQNPLEYRDIPSTKVIPAQKKNGRRKRNTRFTYLLRTNSVASCPVNRYCSYYFFRDKVRPYTDRKAKIPTQ